MNDMTPFIAPKSDQLTADDLIAGERIITITGVRVDRSAEQPCEISFEGDDGKPWRPCKTMGRVLVKAWGPDANKYVGKSVQLYRDPDVTWAGMKVGGIRIRALSHINAPFDMALTATRGKKSMARFLPLKDAPAKDDPAKKWADAYIASVNRMDDADALSAFANEKAKRLDELQAKRPELHRACVESLDAKRASFAPADDEWGNDGTLAADNPTAAEGPADDQRGDSFADDEWSETRSPADRVGDLIAEANGRASWEAAKAEFERARAEMSDDEAASVQAALDAKRASLVKG